MTPPINEIITIISTLPLKEALSYLIGVGIVKLSGKGLTKIKQIIQDKNNEGKFAFVPNKEEAQRLTHFANEPNYKKLSLLIPQFEYIDVVRTGLLMQFYHKRNDPNDKDKVQNIKSQLYQRPNGQFLVKLAIISAESDSLSAILDYLLDLKTNENYSEKQLHEKLNERIFTWDACAMLVDKKDKVNDIIDFCKTKMLENCYPEIFLMGMKHSAENIEKSINKLSKDIAKHKYTPIIKKFTEGNKPRITIILKKKELI
jgi:hypothetical protein